LAGCSGISRSSWCKWSCIFPARAPIRDAWFQRGGHVPDHDLEPLLRSEALDHLRLLAGPAWGNHRWAAGLTGILSGLDQLLESVAIIENGSDDQQHQGEFLCCGRKVTEAAACRNDFLERKSRSSFLKRLFVGLLMSV